MERQLILFQSEEGKEPYAEWLLALRDTRTQARIANRVDRLRLGNPGDWKSVGDGVMELRVDFGPGYRVYFAYHGSTIVVLLCGGDKRTQRSDIQRAKRFWREYQESNPR